MVRLLRKKEPGPRIEFRSASERLAKKGVRCEVRDGQGKLVKVVETGDKEVLDKIRREMATGRIPWPLMAGFGEETGNRPLWAHGESWSFLTSVVVESDSVERGVIGMSGCPAGTPRKHSKVKVVAVPGGRSKSMEVRVSPHLGAFEVELNEADIEELGISDGGDTCLKVMSEDSGHSPQPKGRHVPGRMGDGKPPRKVKVPVGSRLVTDNEAPPYTVESGLGFWGRRKRK